jgi:hypothetical protein
MNMPNRGELAMPAVRAAKSTDRSAKAESGDAWTIIGFCAIGWLLSIYAAVATLGVDAVPRLMTQFPGLM